MGITDRVPALDWLPTSGDFDEDFARVRNGSLQNEDLYRSLVNLADRKLDILQTTRLDKVLNARKALLPPRLPTMKLALLGDVTLDHLAASIRIGAFRRGLLINIRVGPFGQWRQEILDFQSELYVYKPDAVLLAADPARFLPDVPLTLGPREADRVAEAALDELSEYWRALRAHSHATIIQQTTWHAEPTAFGHFGRLVPGSREALENRLDLRLVDLAAAKGVLLLDLRTVAANAGTRHVTDLALWHHAKQMVAPAAAPWVGDQVARIAAASRGLSRKLLVLDLDGTLWGGTIGDDGLTGITLGEGSGAGEAFLAFQRYLKILAARGILLAISSKNDQSAVEAALDQHPEMLLRRAYFAAIEANWRDKPSAVRRIAENLNLGLDAVVFFDDSPFERALMRQTLPDVAVPEVPEAPELYAHLLADAGYFEAVSFTADDSQRAAQYVANRSRDSLRSSTTDLDTFLRELRMTLKIEPFRPEDLPRITQLINKTNQFNLTTRRYTDNEVRSLMNDPSALTFSARVSDRFGDNGLTSVVIVRLAPHGVRHTAEIDTWLMSCRVLGRRIEHALFSVVASEVRAAGIETLIGRYRPTARNAMVKDLYPSLGFQPIDASGDAGERCWIYSLTDGPSVTADHLEIIHTRESHGSSGYLQGTDGDLAYRI